MLGSLQGYWVGATREQTIIWNADTGEIRATLPSVSLVAAAVFAALRLTAGSIVCMGYLIMRGMLRVYICMPIQIEWPAGQSGLLYLVLLRGDIT